MDEQIRVFAEWFYKGLILVAKGMALGVGAFLLFILVWLFCEEISNKIHDWRHRKK